VVIIWGGVKSLVEQTRVVKFRFLSFLLLLRGFHMKSAIFNLGNITPITQLQYSLDKWDFCSVEQIFPTHYLPFKHNSLI